jgi:hypothetical protein
MYALYLWDITSKFRTVTMLVITDVKAIFRMQYGGAFVICLCTMFYMPTPVVRSYHHRAENQRKFLDCGHFIILHFANHFLD